MSLNRCPKLARAAAKFFTALAGCCLLSGALAAEDDYQKRIEPLLKNYCFDCHGDGMKKGEVAFDEYTNLAAHIANQKLWLAVWQNLQSQMMPPAKKTQPSEEEPSQITKWIERAVFKLDPANP